MSTFYNSYEYGESQIYYDPSVVAGARTQLSKLVMDVGDQADAVEEVDKYFDGVPSRYSSLIPQPRFSSLRNDIEGKIRDCQINFSTELDNMITAVVDYSNGEGFAPENKKILDKWLPKGEGDEPSAPTTPKKSSPDGGDDGSSRPSTNEDLTITDEPTNELIISKKDESLDSSNVNSLNEELVIPTVDAAITSTASGALSSTSASEVIDEGFTSILTDEGLLGSVSASFSSIGDGVFSVPGLTISAIDEIKKSSVAIPAVVAALAATGLGGKVFYDKKKEEDEEKVSDEEVINTSEDVEKENLEQIDDTGADVFDYIDNSVAFKNELMNDEGDDE